MTDDLLLYWYTKRMLEYSPSKKMSHSPEHSNNMSKISKQWHLLFNRKKQGKNIQSYLECQMPPAVSSSPLKTRILSHSLGAAILEREIKLKKNNRPRNKQKLLQITDFDDREIRQNSHSLDMHNNSSISFKTKVKSNSSEKKTPCRIALPLHNPIKKNNPTPSTPSSPKPSNQFIKNILKKYQDHKSTLQSIVPDNCISIIKSRNSPCPSPKPSQSLQQRSKSIGRRARPPTIYARHHIPSNKQRIHFKKPENKPASSDIYVRGNGEPTHQQISPWYVSEEQL